MCSVLVKVWQVFCSPSCSDLCTHTRLLFLYPWHIHTRTVTRCILPHHNLRKTRQRPKKVSNLKVAVVLVYLQRGRSSVKNRQTGLILPSLPSPASSALQVAFRAPLITGWMRDRCVGFETRSKEDREKELHTKFPYSYVLLHANYSLML